MEVLKVDDHGSVSSTKAYNYRALVFYTHVFLVELTVIAIAVTTALGLNRVIIVCGTLDNRRDLPRGGGMGDGGRGDGEVQIEGIDLGLVKEVAGECDTAAAGQGMFETAP